VLLRARKAGEKGGGKKKRKVSGHGPKKENVEINLSKGEDRGNDKRLD